MKNLMIYSLFMAFGLTAFASKSFAFQGNSVTLAPAFIYSSTEIDNNGTTTSGSGILYDFRAGYTLGSGLYLGAIYSSNTTDDGTSLSPQVTSMGVSVGYGAANGFYGIFHYLLQSTYSDVGVNTDLTKGTGIQVDLGFHHFFNKNFGLGPQLTYRSLTFKELDTAGVTTDYDYKQTTIEPQISLVFNF